MRSNETFGAQLTDWDILAQIDSITFSGHDTTSLVIEWGLWELTRFPTVQARIRAELEPLVPMLRNYAAACPSDECNVYADLDGELGDLAMQIDALPYLENFVREVLRHHPSVQSTLRVAQQDEIIPVSGPIYAGEKGELSKAYVEPHHCGFPGGGIRVRKGEFVHIPIEGINMTTQVWGESAHEFKYVCLSSIKYLSDLVFSSPDRWNDLPPSAKANPGLYAGLMSFSIGPSVCADYLVAPS